MRLNKKSKKIKMCKRIDITNKIFGKIKVLEFVENNNTHAVYKCLCTRCGRKIKVTYSNLISGNTKSCQSCGNKIGEELELKIKKEILKDKKISHIAKELSVSRGAVNRVKKEIYQFFKKST